MFSILSALLVFCLIIVVHELGHFTAAKIFKMRVYEFSIGMGPRIWKSKKKNEEDTLYSIKAIPFGGSVQLGEADEFQEDLPKTENTFQSHPVWQRMIVILAGVFMNIVLAFVLCIVLVGMEKRFATTTIAAFQENPNYPPSICNTILQPNDKIVSIEGLSVITTSDVYYKFINTQLTVLDKENEGQPDKTVIINDQTVELYTSYFSMEVLRSGEKLKFEKVPFYYTQNENGDKEIHAGIIYHGEDVNFLNAFTQGFKVGASSFRLIFMTFIDLLKGTYGINAMGGPVGIVGQMSEITKGLDILEATKNLIYIGMMISLNVAIFNLLPVPALDGCRFCFFVIEAIRRKPINQRIEGYIHAAGFLALIIFALVITFNDIVKLVQG